MASMAKNRDAYVGERNKQIREGYGVYSYENQFFRYEGEWKDGKKHGHGKLVMADGSYYEGTFENGEIEGHGFRYYASSGNTYSGEFHQGELHGQGVMKYKDGSVYEGMWAFNKRSGYGVFKNKDSSSLYQGYLHNHMRHGEGTQIYSNGDRFDGDWVNDKRQGHGELRCADGTLFDGQWMNDMLHGQGSMHHSSGMHYEGLWYNGKPANMASKLVITNASPINSVQGTFFEISIECQNEEGVAMKDQGRELLITAGYKNVLPTPVVGKGKKSSVEVANLFDVIEDVEEKPVMTPFGYDMVSYPLTDEMPDRETLGDPPVPEPTFMSSRQATNMTEASDVAAELQEGVETTEEKKEEEVEKKEESEGDVKKPNIDPQVPVGEEGTPEGAHEGAQEGAQENAVAEAVSSEVRQEEVVYPPVDKKRTEEGQCVFSNLILPGAPLMYRPFMVLDEEAHMDKVRSLSKVGKKTKGGFLTDVKIPSFIPEDTKARAKKFGDERYARPGEYVILVQDVTTPPFMGVVLEPAFIQVKQVLPKKVKKEKVKKEKNPNDSASESDFYSDSDTFNESWDTINHVSSMMKSELDATSTAELSAK